MLITDHYREQNRVLHDKARFYGFHGWRRARKVTKLVRQYGAESVLGLAGALSLSTPASRLSHFSGV